jgi:hypothetical protein
MTVVPNITLTLILTFVDNPMLGESQTEKKKIRSGYESRGTRTREGLPWRGPAETVNYRPVLSSDRRPIIKDPQISKENFKQKENWSRSQDRTDWTTDLRS